MTGVPVVRTSWRWPAGLLLAHLLVQLLVRPFPRWLDGIVVFDDARDFPQVPLDHYSMRLGLVLPAKLFIAVFGYGQVAYYAWPLLCSLLLVLATYSVGCLLAGRRAGVVAAMVVIASPLLVVTDSDRDTQFMTSWQLLPDVTSAAWFTAGVACLLGGVRRPAPDQPSRALLAAAGGCFGLAYLIRELIPFLFPTVVVLLLLWRVPWRRWVWVAGPMLGCLCFELAVAGALFGSPLARFRLGGDEGREPPLGYGRVDALTALWTGLRHYPLGLAVLLTVLATVLAPVLTRRRESVLTAVWVVSYWVPMTAAAGALRPDRLWVAAYKPRYWLPVLPAAAIGSAVLLAWLLPVLTRRWPATARPVTRVVVCLALVVCYAIPMAAPVVHHPRDRSWNSLRVWLHDHDAEVTSIVTDERDALNLRIYQYDAVGGNRQWNAQVRALAPHQSRVPAPGDGAELLLWSRWLTDEAPDAAGDWERVWAQGAIALYRVHGD